MQLSYKTITRAANAEVIIKKSRFVAHAMPTATEAEAVRCIEQIRRENWNATHNCFAYMIGMKGEFQKQSDDGEPGGTAGKPILEVIKNRKLTNITVVVTRYYGGIMLGAGGLIRAYSECAAAGVEASMPVWQLLHGKVSVEIDYTWLGLIENELRNKHIKVGETLFTDKVTICCYPLFSEVDGFISWMADATQGQASLTHGEAVYMASSSIADMESDDP